MTYGSLTQVEYFYSGQIVRLKHPTGVYAMEENNFFTVTKVNPKKLKVTQNSTGKSLQGDHTIFTAVPKDEVAEAPKAPEKPQVDFSQFRTGAVVKYVGSKPPKGLDVTKPYIVTKHNFELVNIFPLGGTMNGLYFRTSPKNIEVVDPTNILFL